MARNDKIRWAEDDRKWISTWQPQVQRDFKSVTQQVGRISESIPRFGKTAEKAAKPFLTMAGVLLELSRQRVFQTIARDQAEKLLLRLQKSLQPWIAFMNRRETSEAIRKVNNQIRKGTKQHRQLVDAMEREIVAALNSASWDAKLDDVAMQCERGVNDMVEMARSLKQSGSEEDVPILRRLSLVWLIRGTYDFNKPRQMDLEKYIAIERPENICDLLRHAIYLVYRDGTVHKFKKPESFMPGLNDPQSILVGCQGSAFSGLCDMLGRWNKHGLNSKSLPAGEFDVCGLDCRVEALPGS